MNWNRSSMAGVSLAILALVSAPFALRLVTPFSEMAQADSPTTLSVQMAVQESVTTPGADLHYRITVMNTGTAEVVNAYLEDYLHPNMLINAVLPDGCSVVTFNNGGEGIRCFLGGLAPMNTTYRDFVLKTTQNYACNNGAVARNSAGAYAQNAPSVSTPVVITQVNCPAPTTTTLAITKTTTAQSTMPGMDIPYKVTVRNNGSVAATNVEFDDYLHPNMQIVTYTGDCTQTTFSNGATGVRCSLGTIAPGNSAERTVIYRTAANHACNNGAVARNSAAARASNAPEVTTDMLTTPVTCASSSSSSSSSISSSSSMSSSSSSSIAATNTTLSIQKIVNQTPNQTQPGQNISYRITIQNTGSVPATQVYIDDYIHPNMLVVSYPSGCGLVTFPNGGEGVRCYVGTVNPGQSLNGDFVFRTTQNHACNNGAVARNAAGTWAANAPNVTTPVIVTPVVCASSSSSSSSSISSSISSSSSYNPCTYFPSLCSSSSSSSSMSSSSSSVMPGNTTLTVDKTVDEISTTPGAQLHYRLRVRNMGGVTATQTYVDDYIHPNMQVVQMDNQCGLVTYPNGAMGVRCYLGDLMPGQAAYRNLIYRTASNYPCGNGSVARNSAGAWASNAQGVTTPLIVTPVLCTSSSSSSSLSSSSSSSSFNPCTYYPWLCSSSSSSSSTSSSSSMSSQTTVTVHKIVAETQTVPGGFLNYRIFVQNTGNAVARNAVFDDYIHPNMNAHSMPAGCGIVTYPNGATGVRCTLGDLAPGQTVYRDLVFRLAPNHACNNGAVARNAAGAWADNAQGVTTPLIVTPVYCNGSSSSSSSTSSSSSSFNTCYYYPWLCSSSSSSSSSMHPCYYYPWLCSSSSSSRYSNERFNLVKRASTSEVFPGGIIEYTLRVENDTDRDLTNVIVTDRFEDRDLQVTDDGGADDEDRGELVWRLGTLRRGDEEVIRYRMRVRSSVYPGTRIRNDAEVRTNEGYTDRDSVTVNVIGSLPQTGALQRLMTGNMLQPMGAQDSSLPLATLLTLGLTGLSGGLWFGRKFFLS